MLLSNVCKVAFGLEDLDWSMQCSATAASSMQQQAQTEKRSSERARTDAIEPEFAGEQP